MSDKQKENPPIYIAGRKSVKQAVELLQTKLENKKRNWNYKNDERSRKITLRCTSMPWQKKSCLMSLTPFSKSLFVLEAKSHLAKQNWMLLQRLFPFLPDCSNDIEYLTWRYALTILLYSPDSDASHLQQFLELCIGNQGVNDKKELERLLLLQNGNTTALNS